MSWSLCEKYKNIIEIHFIVDTRSYDILPCLLDALGAHYQRNPRVKCVWKGSEVRYVRKGLE